MIATMRPCVSACTAGQGLNCDSVNVLSPDPRPRLSFTDDGPGNLSVCGPRHDNDHQDYKKIKILPTADEILAVDRPTYMPKKDLHEPHFLDNGPARLLDTLFRQLRYDSIESIRDICYSASQVAFLGSGTAPEGHVRHETEAGNRYFLYNNVKIEELLSHEQMTMLVRVSYDCPSFMRAQKLYDSGRFQKGMLVALLQLDHATMKLSVYFMEVHLAQSTFSMDCFDGHGTRAAVQLSFLPTTSHDDVLQLCRHALGLCTGSELYLVEFPKLLFAGFYNCLKRLQQMRETDFSFQSYVAPETDVNEALLARKLNSVTGSPPRLACPPPSYALSSDFAYNLAKIVPPTCPIASASVGDLSRPSTLDILKRETTLDEGQAVAFRDSLMREYACTQGPPGCGKTFLGVQLAKTLLDSRPSQKPILLVCLTNHALDSFLADLRDAGVSNLLRVGSASKEDWTDAINLRNLRRKTRLKKQDAQMLHAHDLKKKLLFAELDSLCKALSSQTHTSTPPWHYVEDILRNKYPDVHSQFMTNSRVSLAQSFTFEYWSGGGDLETIRDLHLELASRLAQTSKDGAKPTQANVDEILLDISYHAELQSANAGESSIWNLPLSERQLMLRRWEAEVDKEEFANKVVSLYSESQEYIKKIKTISDGRDVQVMSSQNIIAMTTTACAARWELLRSLDLEVLICEEAAEVMEAHALCTLLPSLKHAIFIGDPQQLRPETNEQTLSLETSVGRQYRLDESLLERLMFPHDLSASIIPSSHLSIQRRMHPDIANITRLTYPYLKDHESTVQRSPTHGLAHRIFWWDHRVPELASDDLKSHANLHEVEMVASLVTYLLRGGAYSQGEIAVLTPYAGQLLKLYERLGATCDIWLSQKDREALLGEEVLSLGDEGKTTKDEVAISDMLRIATVDNFQGEEAKVIILSTVRSGAGRVTAFTSLAIPKLYLKSPGGEKSSTLSMGRLEVRSWLSVMCIPTIAISLGNQKTSKTSQTVQRLAARLCPAVTPARRHVTHRSSILVWSARRNVLRSSHRADTAVRSCAIRSAENARLSSTRSPSIADIEESHSALETIPNHAARHSLAAIFALENVASAIPENSGSMTPACTYAIASNHVAIFARRLVMSENLALAHVSNPARTSASMDLVQIDVKTSVTHASSKPSLDVSMKHRQPSFVVYRASHYRAADHARGLWNVATTAHHFMARRALHQTSARNASLEEEAPRSFILQNVDI
ncbi:hypothetical protein AYO22_00118 [Fonsecaea multimorphosa]|nr:hypothetical protein AYO22_00118 [Fonsecaea multimorphosa]